MEPRQKSARADSWQSGRPQPRGGAICGLRGPCPRERDAGGGGSGPGDRAQVLGLDVVQAGLAGAACHHRSFARIGLEDVHDRAGTLLLVAVRHEAHARVRDLAPEGERYRHPVADRVHPEADELGRVGARARATEPGDVDHFLLLQASQGRDGVVDEGEVGGGAELRPLTAESARAVEHQEIEAALERVDDRVLQITA